MKQIIILSALVLFSANCALSGTTTPPLKLVAKYAMPSSAKNRFDHLGVDLKNMRLFVVAENGHEVLVFDLHDGKLLHTIPVGHPHAVLYRPELDRIYITDEEKGQLGVYDGKSYKLLQTVPLKVDADSIGYDPATHDLYIDNGGDNAHENFTMLSVVDTTNDKKLADIKIDGDTLEAMALEKSGDRLYLNNPAKNEVEVIDRKTNSLITSWPVKLGKGNSTMALDEPTHRLFVGCRSGQIVVFDTQTGKELQALPVGLGVDDLMFDPATKRIYATCGRAATVDVYQEKDPDHYQLLAQVPSASGGKTGILVPRLGRLYVPVAPQNSAPAQVYVYSLK